MDKGGSDNTTLRNRKQNMVPRVKPDLHQNLEPDIMASSSSSSSSPKQQKLTGANGNGSNHSSKYLHTKAPSRNSSDPVSNKDIAETNMDDALYISNGTKGGAGEPHINDAGDSADDDVADDDDTCQLLPSREQEGDDDDLNVIVEDEVGGVNVNNLIQSMRGQESSWSIISQVSLPFIIAGYGTVGAGMVLDIVQHWEVFLAVKEIFILVPALLGLKGNLEMTLASRLSTQANLGNMDSKKELMKMVGGNLALVQAQAIVVGLLSSLTAMVLGWIPKGEFNVHHALLLCASSLFTATSASLVLGGVMVFVVLTSRYFSINPDNVATPIAASLGDLVTLALLAWISNTLFEAIGKQHWLAPTVIVLFLVLLPIWVVICIKNTYTNDVIYSGWVPVLSAMMIS
ncbi:hypothetical protein RRG08_019828, partial [Elysia crispata]